MPSQTFGGGGGTDRARRFVGRRGPALARTIALCEDGTDDEVELELARLESPVEDEDVFCLLRPLPLGGACEVGGPAVGPATSSSGIIFFNMSSVASTSIGVEINLGDSCFASLCVASVLIGGDDTSAIRTAKLHQFAQLRKCLSLDDLLWKHRIWNMLHTYLSIERKGNDGGNLF